jgi:hypothetical protein
MPILDPQTAIRFANDLDRAEEAAWTRIELEGWIPTPQLLFALKQVHRERMIEVYGTEHP